MRHVLLVSADDGLVDRLRAAASPSTTFLPEPRAEAALERLARSARIDAVVTDEASVAEAIREEIPGALPLHVAAPGETAEETLRALDALLSGK